MWIDFKHRDEENIAMEKNYIFYTQIYGNETVHVCH